MPASSNNDNRTTIQDTSTGLVIVNYGKSMLVENSDGRLHRCVARRNLDTIVSGDCINWEPTGDGKGVITSIEPRHSILTCTDIADRSRPLAANIDQIMIVAAPEPELDEFLIDKYTIAAELTGTIPCIVINKADLVDTDMRGELESRLDDYAAIGYRVIFTSALQGDGLESLADQLQDKTSILVGQSGTGKSSLIKRLLPDLDIAIGKLSDASGQGRHTTTTTTMYHLPHGGDLIDSPGVRDFRLGQVEPGTLAGGFREFHALPGQCKFNNCRHLLEPECAVINAAVNGSISRRRLESYRQLLATTGSSP